MIFDTYSIIGWIGIIFIIFSYVLLSSKTFRKDYALYHLFNFMGAVGLIISTFVTESWPALTLSLIFAVISLVYIAKILSTNNPYKELRID